MGKRVKSVRQLNDELFKLVQAHQGFAHISDGMTGMVHREKFFEAVRFALDHSCVATTRIRGFLTKYGELGGKRRG